MVQRSDLQLDSPVVFTNNLNTAGTKILRFEDYRASKQRGRIMDRKVKWWLIRSAPTAMCPTPYALTACSCVPYE